MTPGRAAVALDALGRHIERETKRALQAEQKAVLARAKQLSSGPYSTAQLRAMYNPYGPYSRRRPHPPAAPSIINAQAGRFLAAWETPELVETGQGITGAIENDARSRRGFPYGQALATGTKLMIARPLPERVTKEEDAGFRERVGRALDKAIAG